MARKKLYVGQPTSSAAAATADSTSRFTITAATACNASGGADTLDAWVVPSGGSADNTNKVYDGLNIADGAQVGLQFLAGHTLDAGERVYLATGSGSSITVRLSGDEHT